MAQNSHSQRSAKFNSWFMTHMRFGICVLLLSVCAHLCAVPTVKTKFIFFNFSIFRNFGSEHTCSIHLLSITYLLHAYDICICTIYLFILFHFFFFRFCFAIENMHLDVSLYGCVHTTHEPNTIKIKSKYAHKTQTQTHTHDLTNKQWTLAFSIAISFCLFYLCKIRSAFFFPRLFYRCSILYSLAVLKIFSFPLIIELFI